MGGPQRKAATRVLSPPAKNGQGDAQGHEEGDGEEGDGHEAPPRHEEEGRAGGGADEGDAEEVSPSWAHISKGRVSWRIDSSTATCGTVRWLTVCRAFCISVSFMCTH